MVELEFFGLALDEHSRSPIVILKDKDERHVLPVWIGALEAMAISMVVNKVTMPRPMTHDLFLDVLQNFESTLVRAELVALRKGVYYAELVLQGGEKEVRIDCRPSDAIALALRGGVPIMARGDLLEAIAHPQDEFQAELDGPEARKWTDVLASYSLEDLKYRM